MKLRTLLIELATYFQIYSFLLLTRQDHPEGSILADKIPSKYKTHKE